MKKGWLFVPILLLSGCLEEDIKSADVSIYNPSGDELGKIKITEQPDGVKMKIDLEGLPPGEHAIHIHNKGKCSPPDYKSAGEHLNPDKKEHGLLHPKGAHAGDLPNLIVEGDGTVKAELMGPQLTFKDGKYSLFTKDGTSIVIHEGKDDGMAQPAGDSGSRIACGKISKK